MAAILGENEIVSTREFEFSRERVFEAWVNPELLKRWWGPNGFTNTFHEFEIKPGGNWRFTMHGPNGVDYENHNVFEEIVPLERIVLKHMSNPEFRVTAIFEDLDGRARLTFRQLFMDKRTFEAVKAYAADGNEQNFDRLKLVLQEG
ncbi:SRPBCC family protein [Paenibacillus sp. ATY16]|uniref:SRPBCC family protein n=1 Tax=Paenibacillus sp. ATY16 TaxID=1759312 RepID=UPI00200FC616|nr:SRPBCC family protein [Paenibacillus sp. ATY16]MCK9857672.1 SRPBCC family protein [Paenibacillus sp. ATY16]